MSGRATRARLLAPSFLVVVSAFACGGKADTGGGPDEGGGGGSAGTGFNFGGTSNPPAPTCPAAVPARGSGCYGLLSCDYPSNRIYCGLPNAPILATCDNSSWVIEEYIASCNPPMPVMCPPTMPAEGAQCPEFTEPGNICVYPSAVCIRESATCKRGNWRLTKCEVLGEGGASGAGGQPPNFGGAPDSAGAPGDAGAPQGGVGGS